VNQQSEAAASAAEASSQAPNCVVTEDWVDRIVIVSATGDIDMLSAPALEGGIRTAIGKDPGALVVDFSTVEFLASAGMGVLVAIHDEIAPNVEFCVVADGPATSRPLKLVGIADIIRVYPTLDEALSSLNA
jgi:anti-sigma B factor antagonist